MKKSPKQLLTKINSAQLLSQLSYFIFWYLSFVVFNFCLSQFRFDSFVDFLTVLVSARREFRPLSKWNEWLLVDFLPNVVVVVRCKQRQKWDNKIQDTERTSNGWNRKPTTTISLRDMKMTEIWDPFHVCWRLREFKVYRKNCSIQHFFDVTSHQHTSTRDALAPSISRFASQRNFSHSPKISLSP